MNAGVGTKAATASRSVPRGGFRASGGTVALCVFVLVLIGACAALQPAMYDPGPAPEFNRDEVTWSAGEVRPPVLYMTDGERKLTVIGTIHTLPDQNHDQELSFSQELYDELERADLVVVESDLLTLEPLDRLIQTARVRQRYMESGSEAETGFEHRRSFSHYLQDRDENLPEEFGEELEERMPQLRRHQIEQLLELRPWAARDRLWTLRRAYDHGPDSFDSGLDGYVVETARAAETPVAYLETWEELARTFDEAPQEHYVQELLFSVLAGIDEDRLAEARREYYYRVLEAWSTGEIDTLRWSAYAYLDEPVPVELREAWDAERELLLKTREKRWVPRLLQKYDDTGAEHVVLAVGAAHIGDRNSVLIKMLEEAGFKIADAEAGLGAYRSQRKGR